LRCGAKAVLLEALDDAESLQLIICAEQGYRGQLEDSVFIVCGCKLEMVKRNEPGFKILPRRWLVKRTFAWLGNNRNLSKDYEELREVSEAMVYAVMTRLLLCRDPII
jgi:putative transposase